MISIDIDDREVIAALKHLRDRAGDAGLRPALALIGEHMVETTKQRFATSTAPDGSRWAPNAESTLARLLNQGKGAGKRPLVDTGQLADTIRWQPIQDGVTVGTDRFANEFAGGAAVHQFGGHTRPHTILPRNKKALAFGGRVFGKVEHPGSKIPARPFLGISNDDRSAILAIVAAHFAGNDV